MKIQINTTNNTTEVRRRHNHKRVQAKKSEVCNRLSITEEVLDNFLEKNHFGMCGCTGKCFETGVCPSYTPEALEATIARRWNHE